VLPSGAHVAVRKSLRAAAGLTAAEIASTFFMTQLPLVEAGSPARQLAKGAQSKRAFSMTQASRVIAGSCELSDPDGAQMTHLLLRQSVGRVLFLPSGISGDECLIGGKPCASLVA